MSEDADSGSLSSDGSGNGTTSDQQQFRLLIGGGVMALLVVGVVLIILAISRGGGHGTSNEKEKNVLADSDNECVVCHRRNTPGIVEQYGHSDKAAAGVSCQDCHEVEEDYPGATKHQGTFVLSSPTPKVCAQCHEQEVSQFNQSRHGIPAYAAMWGEETLNQKHKEMFKNIPEAKTPTNKARNILFKKEGRDITKFACERCHNIGEPRKDGSVGRCQKCHLRHEFSLEQARKPETCNACHIGPDHPQYEIYTNSPHGIAYHTQGDNWNWDAEAGTQSVEDFPAPTCATCHMSGFGGVSSTHDVGERLSWYLFPPISTKRPAWQENRRRMKNVCSECHNRNHITQFYEDADRLTKRVNEWVRIGQGMMEYLRKEDVITDEKFDESIEYEMFELWHHWGRTTKFGAWMLGPDYTQWHGAYEMLRSLTDLREDHDDLLEEHGKPVPETEIPSDLVDEEKEGNENQKDEPGNPDPSSDNEGPPDSKDH